MISVSMNTWPQLGLCAAVAFLSVGCPLFTASPPPVPVTTVSVQPSNPTFEAGIDGQLTATPLGPSGQVLTGRVITWSSSNETVARVSGDGRVTAISPGLVTIVATAEGKSGQASVRVVVPQVTNVDVKPSTFSLVGGDRRRFEATARSSQGLPISGCTFSFVSANPALATVEPDGTVVAQSRGNVAINVLASCGEAGTGAGSASVEVLEPMIGVLTPLTDAPAHSYKGQALGLFDGRNSPSLAHDAAGIASAAAVQPIGGKIVFISIGMSNASQEFETWGRGHQQAAGGTWRNGEVWLVNCASGGGTVEEWDDASEVMYDRCRDHELAPADLTEADVQVVWGKLVTGESGIALPDPDADA